MTGLGWGAWSSCVASSTHVGHSRYLYANIGQSRRGDAMLEDGPVEAVAGRSYHPIMHG